MSSYPSESAKKSTSTPGRTPTAKPSGAGPVPLPAHMTPAPTIVLLPGDGIGPEIMREAVRVLEWFARERGFDCDYREESFGVATWHKTGRFMREGLISELLAAMDTELKAIP